jgi:hypothetical protein
LSFRKKSAFSMRRWTGCRSTPQARPTDLWRSNFSSHLISFRLGPDGDTKPHCYFPYSIRRNVHSFRYLVQALRRSRTLHDTTVILKRPTLRHCHSSHLKQSRQAEYVRLTALPLWARTVGNRPVFDQHPNRSTLQSKPCIKLYTREAG